MIAALLRNLLAGARLALFLRLRPFDFRVSAPDFALLVLFNIIVWLSVSGARVGFEGEFDSWALIVYFAAVPLVLAAAMVVSLVYGAPQRLLAVATALTAPAWRPQALRRFSGSSESNRSTNPCRSAIVAWRR